MITSLSVCAEVLHVPEENGQLHEIGGSAADRFKGYAEVAEHLIDLSAEVILADQRAVFIKCGLARR